MYMKHSTCILLIIFSLISSCATLNISEIRNLERIEFDALKLSPGSETNNLRIDLIRQKYQDPATIVDSTITYRDTPYHPLGFDLGNGLFYDLNENFCLRVDYILGFQPDHNFEVYKINKPEKNKGIINYKFYNDSLTLVYPPGNKTKYYYHKAGDKDSVSYLYKNRLRYSIIQNDSSIVYRGKNRKWNTIRKMDENNFYEDLKRKNNKYQLEANNVLLKNTYVISLTNNNKTIEIKEQRKGDDRVVYTIEKSKDEIFIYTKKYSGVKIKYTEKNITIYQNNTLLAKYELKNKS